jgi:hypothetical protein
VLCSRHPDGEVAVATIGRNQGKTVVIPLADITLEVGALDRPVGIFGEYASLNLATTSALAGKRILAQDLAGLTPVDITSEVTVSDGRLTIPGAVIHRVGLMAAKPGDSSDPGLVLAIPGLTKLIPKPAMTPGKTPDRPKPVAEPGAGLKAVVPILTGIAIGAGPLPKPPDPASAPITDAPKLTLESPDGNITDLGKYVTVARRRGDTWFVASMSDAHAQSYNLPLNFLRPGAAYQASIYADTPGRPQTAHSRIAVSSTSVVPIAMEPNGGHLMLIEPARSSPVR